MKQTTSNRDKITNPDVKPSKGQESNVNWDDSREQKSGTDSSHARSMDEQSNTSGYGSSQKASKENVGPLDADFGELPSEKRRDSGRGVE